jgi:GTPase
VAIVDPTAGVTRDRVTHLMVVRDHYFELVDTGGMGIKDTDNLTAEVEEQIEAAIESAAVILFVLDTQTGITPLDEQVVKRLRYVDVPVICVANKTDTQALDPQADEFYKLGRGKLVKVSTAHNRGKDELIHLILDRLPKESLPSQAPIEPEMKVAIVGSRNTGKSTFVNTLAHAERMIVSEVPGTTRDSVDVRFEMDDKAFIAIDTPGLQRKKNIDTNIEFYSLNRAQKSVRRADVVFMFFDCSQQIARVDKQLAGYIVDEFKPCIFVVNKWDLLAGSMPTEKWVRYLRDTFRTMPYAPIAFVTGQAGRNVKALINHGQMLFKQARSRVGTAELNNVVQAAVERNPPPADKGRNPKIFFATQVGVEPPTIVLFCNHPSALDQTYRRYLLNTLRDHLPFSEVPIKLYLRKRDSHGGARRDEAASRDVDADTEAAEA